MCLSKAYTNKSTDKPFFENIAYMRLYDGRIELGTLFGEEKVISGRVVEIDFLTSQILLNTHPEADQAPPRRRE